MNDAAHSLAFRSLPLRARFEEFSLPAAPELDAVAIVPAVRSTRWLRYGEHAYYCMDFRRRRGICITLGHGAVVRPGLARFRRAAADGSDARAWWRCLSRRYHYEFSVLEELMLMSVPHTVTDLGGGRFLVNLWAYPGYLLLDCQAKTATYQLLDDDSDIVLGAKQWYDANSGDRFALAYSLRDSLARISDPERGVAARILRFRAGADRAECLWAGSMADFLHDLAVSPDGKFWAVCELGMYPGRDGVTLPSRVLVGNTGDGWSKPWRLDRIRVAAHAEFDPDAPDTVYFSSHNFQFEHTSLPALLRQATYTVRFHGPAAIFKYRLTPSGPQEMGCFSRPDFKRLTNMHAFRCGGRTIIAAMSFPDEIFLIDPATMSWLGKITIVEPPGVAGAGQRAVIGTMAPSPDGTRLLVQTTWSFQVVDIERGVADVVYCNGRRHSCANHMCVSRGTT